MTIKNLIILTIYLFSFPNLAFSKVVFFDFEDKVRESDFIVIGTVTNISENIFSKNIATINSKEFIVGNSEKLSIDIRYGRDNIFIAKEDRTELLLENNYVFFLKKENSVCRLIGAHQGYYQVSNDGTVVVDGKNVNLNDFKEKIRSIKKNSPPINKKDD